MAVIGVPLSNDKSWVTRVETLPRWGATVPPEYDIHLDNPEDKKISPFPYRPDINRKLILWTGDITTLNTDAIVHCTNETLTSMEADTCRLLARAGSQLKDEMRTNVRSCRTGEAKLTQGYRLAARYVIHSVAPRYTERYRTAAETALFNCYRSILKVVREELLESVAFCCIHCERLGYSAHEGVHIALRTVRRFLEKFGCTIHTIVFVVSPDIAHIYESCLSLYYPRSTDEADYSAYHLPMDVGNDDGEPIVAERCIRILAKPTDLIDSEDDLDICSNRLLSPSISNHNFCKMEEDIDAIRSAQRLHSASLSQSCEQQSQQERYEHLLQTAKEMNFSELTTRRFLYWSGFDKCNRAVIVCIGKRFPVITENNYNHILLFIIHTVSKVADQPFVAVYFHTESSDREIPPVAFMKHLINVVWHKYSVNLQAIYMVHTSFFNKMLVWLISSLSLSAVKSRIQHVAGLEYLYTRISADQLDVPEFIQQYDIHVNGSRYYKPEEDSQEL